MPGFFRHILFLFALAAACYVVALAFTGGRIGFIVFFVTGLIAELVFWVLFWREWKSNRRHNAGSHA